MRAAVQHCVNSRSGTHDHHVTFSLVKTCTLKERNSTLNLYIENQIRSAIAEQKREVGTTEANISQRTAAPRFRTIAARALIRAAAELDRDAV